MATAEHLHEFLDQQYKNLREEGQKFHNDPSNDRVAVIVEPRNSPLLPKVIRNIMFFVGNLWNLHVFTSSENVSWIREEFANCSFRITPLDKHNLTREEYSVLFMTPAFWNMIPEENILVFQTDSMLFRKGIDVWIDDPEYNYDYVGANYYNPAHTAPEMQGIQGGLSLRKKSVMLECIEKIKHHHIQKYRQEHGYPYLSETVIAEDVFFTHACEMLKKRIPTVEKRREFSIEADYYQNTLGHHGLTHNYFTQEQQECLLSGAQMV